ncbi:MAG: hypothetical protein ACOZNI_13090 [Myxococcota bacterium]
MELVLEADRVDWVDGGAAASGNVSVRWGEERVTAARATWRDGVLHVEEGVWTRPDGELTFASADVRADDASVVDVRARLGDAGVEARVLQVGDTWVATDARLETCPCSAITFRARSIEVVPDRYAVVRGGTARLFDVPVLPVPYWRVPLNPRRFRLDFPEVAHGEYGWAAAIGGRGGVGDWTISGGPAWRQDRGVRGELGVAGPLSLRGEGGWDTLDERARGLVVSEGGVAKDVRAAWDVEVASDPDYVEDFAVDYVARGVAWRESRGVFATEAFRADAWWADDGSVSDNVRMRLRPELGRTRAVAIAPRLEWAAIARDGDMTPVGRVGVDARATAKLADVAADAAIGTDGEIVARAAGRAELPFWSEAGALRVQWWPGARAEASASGEWFAGPSVRAQAAFLGGEAALGWTEAGWRPEVAVEVLGDVVSARVQADPKVQAASLTASLGGVTAVAGSARAASLWLGWGDATVRIGRLVSGGGLAWDVLAGAYAGASTRVGYDDGCVAATLTGAFAPDREVPDVGVAVRLLR